MSLNIITFKLQLFKNKQDRDRSRINLLLLMEALRQINKSYLQKYKTPSIYKTDVIYRTERGEQWKDVPGIIEDGFGDCEDLACWRIAELRLIGIKARPYLKWRKQGRTWIYHALVWLPGNKIEDPSLALGMRGKIIRQPIYIKP